MPYGRGAARAVVLTRWGDAYPFIRHCHILLAEPRRDAALVQGQRARDPNCSKSASAAVASEKAAPGLLPHRLKCHYFDRQGFGLSDPSLSQ
eukprot:6158141-Amphidinium_carterae.1